MSNPKAVKYRQLGASAAPSTHAEEAIGKSRSSAGNKLQGRSCDRAASPQLPL
jgi:hypothetical protein